LFGIIRSGRLTQVAALNRCMCMCI